MSDTQSPPAREVKIIPVASLQSPSGDAATFQGFEHGANVSCFVVTFAQGKGPRRHRHAYEETFVLLEGEIRLITDGTSRTVGGRTIVVIPAGAWHEFQVTSGSPVQMVNIHPVPRMATEWAD